MAIGSRVSTCNYVVSSGKLGEGTSTLLIVVYGLEHIASGVCCLHTEYVWFYSHGENRDDAGVVCVVTSTATGRKAGTRVIATNLHATNLHATKFNHAIKTIGRTTAVL